MTLSEFRIAVDEEFGAGYGRVLVNDLVLPELGRTAAEAIAAGVPPRQVWLALCAEADVPESRRYGVGRPKLPGER